MRSQECRPSSAPKEKFGDASSILSGRGLVKVNAIARGRGNSAVFLNGLAASRVGQLQQPQICGWLMPRRFTGNQSALAKPHPPGHSRRMDIRIPSASTKNGDPVRTGYVTVIENGVRVRTTPESKRDGPRESQDGQVVSEDGPLKVQDHWQPRSVPKLGIAVASRAVEAAPTVFSERGHHGQAVRY